MNLARFLLGVGGSLEMSAKNYPLIVSLPLPSFIFRISRLAAQKLG
jgi:hypothetical protein